MVNILFRDSNVLFRTSMALFLQAIFAEEFQMETQFRLDFNADSVSQANIIALSMCKGEHVTCLPELYCRSNGIIIGLFDQPPSHTESLPNCFSDIVYLSRREPLAQSREKIVEAWLQQKRARYGNCLTCRHKTLTPHQITILAGLYLGKSVSKVARELNITDKSIYTNKYHVMAKFNLKTDHELVGFMRMLVDYGRYQNMFQEALAAGR